VPGWHEKLKGRVQQLGITQEQHGDRCRLFMQWKQMDWPILVDSLNLLAVPRVPYTLLIDEHGIIRNTRPKDADVETFLKTEYPAPGKLAEADTPPTGKTLDAKLAALGKDAASAEQMRIADELFLWGGATRLDTCIDLYSKALASDDGNAIAHFRLGVAMRARHDGEHRQPDDFANAVKHWSRALELNPNQYIWRRRIQQYGPRLDKPYSFYDWINEARAEIKARGETPHPLGVEPSGAEFAKPSKEAGETADETEPDPEGKVLRDKDEFITVKAVVVPSTDAKQRAVRVHVTFTTVGDNEWNNEGEQPVIWLNPPTGWTAGARMHKLENGEGANSGEARALEFEVTAPKDGGPGKLTGYILFNACRKADGTCLYVRKDFEIAVKS
jgi:hypothetical protein